MKKSSLFLILILELFVFQNIYSEETRYVKTDSSNARFILWKVITKEFSDSTNRYIKIKVDSVLKENFHSEAEWILYSLKVEKTSTGYRTYTEKLNLSQNTYYLVLTLASCSEEKANKNKCELILTEKDYILPDTPENRKILSEKWDNTKVEYSKFKPRPKIKGRDIDM